LRKFPKIVINNNVIMPTTVPPNIFQNQGDPSGCCSDIFPPTLYVLDVNQLSLICGLKNLENDFNWGLHHKFI